MKMRKLSAAALALSMLSATTAVVASAADFTKDEDGNYIANGLKFTELSDGTLSVAGLADEELAEVVIPAEVDGKKVTEIGEFAFGYKGLKSVTILDGVTKIDSNAFSGCTNLESIDIPDSVTEIESGAFQNCTSLTSIVLPKGITRIRPIVFSNCPSLKTITIPVNVTEIDAQIFNNIDSFKGTIVDGVYYEGTYISDIYYGGTEEQWERIDFDTFGKGGFDSDPFDGKTIRDYLFEDVVIHFIDDSDDSNSSDIEEESKYAITIEDAVVDGEEKAAVRFSGITSKVMNVAFRNEVKRDDGDQYKIEVTSLNIFITIDIGDCYLRFTTGGEDHSFIGEIRNGNNNETSSVVTKLEEQGETFDIIAYFDKDDEILKDLTASNDATVLSWGEWITGIGLYEADGTPIPAGGGDGFYFDFTSDGKIIAYGPDHLFNGSYDLNGLTVDEVIPDEFTLSYLQKEKVSVINNLSDPDDDDDSSTTEPEKFESGDVKAEADAGVVPEGAELSVEKTEKDGEFTYDIKFVKGEEEVAVDGEVTVTLPVPDALKGKTVYVYYVENGKIKEDMKAEVKDGKVVFTTTHFSEYLLTGEQKEVEASPDTGFAGVAMTLGVVALAGAAVVVSRKKR